MIIKTYEELKFFIEMFKNGNADLLIIESLGGYGKTQMVENVIYVEILSPCFLGIMNGKLMGNMLK